MLMPFQLRFHAYARTAVPSHQVKQKSKVKAFRAALGHVGAAASPICPDAFEQPCNAKVDWVVEIDDSIGALQPFSQRPTIGTIYQPSVGCDYKTKFFADFILAAFDPSPTPVKLVHMKDWQGKL